MQSDMAIVDKGIPLTRRTKQVNLCRLSPRTTAMKTASDHNVTEADRLRNSMINWSTYSPDAYFLVIYLQINQIINTILMVQLIEYMPLWPSYFDTV